MQDDNRRINNERIDSLVGFLYINNGIVLRVGDDTWSVEPSQIPEFVPKYLSYWRRKDGIWESIMGDGGQAGWKEKRFNEVYEEYISEILEKQ